MRRALVALALLAALVRPAGAEPVPVRSGEHADFSRLVFYFPNPVDWRLGRVDGGYELRLADGGQDFDTADIYTFMPRTRVEDVVKTPSGLRLTVRCECFADAFEFRPGLLVIDVKDGEPTALSRFEGGFATDETARPDTQLSPQDQTDPGDIAVATDPEPAVHRELARNTTPTAPDLPLPAFDEAAGGPDRTAATPAVPAPSLDAALEERAIRETLRAELAKGISRAMTQGLVNRVPDLPETAEVSVGDRSPFEDLSHGHGNVHVETSHDRANPNRAPVERSECRSARDFDVGSWGDGEPLAVLGTAREALVADLDAVEDAAALDLARAYLFIGFGAEAQHTLSKFQVTGPSADAARLIAEIMDAPGDAPVPPLQAQLSCDSPAAMWALLAHAGAPLTGTIDEKAVLRTVSALPVSLRHHVAPALSRLARGYGLREMAQAIRDAAFRAPVTPPDALALEQTQATREADPASISPDDLADHASDAGPATLEGMIALLTVAHEEHRHVDQATRDAAGALVHETKGMAGSDTLLRALTSVEIAQHAYADVFDRLDRLERSDFAESYALETVREELFTTLVHDPQDGRFLSVVAAVGPADLPSSLEPDLSRRLADRLGALGFPDEAARFVEPEEEPAPAVDQPTLPPAAAHDTGQRAADIADTVGDDRAEPSSAPSLTETSDTPPDSALAGQAEPPAVVAEDQGAETAQKDLAASSNENAPEPSGAAVITDEAEPPTLARSRALLDASEALRREVEGLLAPPDA